MGESPPVPGAWATRGHIITEQRLTESAALDALSIEQAARLINTQDAGVPIAVRNAIPQLVRLVEAIVPRYEAGGRLIYLGAGTSGRLGVLDASECPPTFHVQPDRVQGIIAGGDRALRKSSEGREDEWAGSHGELAKRELTEQDVVVGIAAGGTTPYVWGGLAYARERGCITSLMTCVPLRTLRTRGKAPVVPANAPIAPPPEAKLPCEVDYPIELLVGPEVVTGSTRMKAGTATKLALNMISTLTMAAAGKVWGNLMVDLRATNTKLRDRAARILMEQCQVDRPDAERLLDEADGRVKLALVMGRLEVDASEAEAKLAAAAGRLRPLLGPPK